jgi:DNA-binding response OmpR family regulator
MESVNPGEVLHADELELRPAEGIALAGPHVLSLSVRELELLAALMRRRGRVVSRGELYLVAWNAPLRHEDRSVDVYIHKLRTKLARVLPERRFIHTHFGFGYRFEPQNVQLSQPLHRAATGS